MRAILLAAAAGAAWAQTPGTSMPSCIYDRPDLGVTYDLTPLSGQDILVQDFRNDSTAAQFDYWFRVCNDMAQYPSSQTTLPYACKSTTGDDGIMHLSGPSPAFQVGNQFSSCKRLGDHASNGVLDILFDQSPSGQRMPRLYARGVKLTYTGGDVCLDPLGSGQYIPRSIEIIFECYANAIVPQQDQVFEDDTCKYRVLMKDIAGCPLQCGATYNGKLCGGHGICGYDATNTKARCFCNEGWHGELCTEFGDAGAPPLKSYAPNIAGGFFGGLFGGLIATVLFSIFKAKSSGGAWTDGLDFSRFFGSGSGVGSPYSYAPAAAAPPGAAFMGATSDSGYVAPDALSGGAPVGLAAAYAPPDGDGPLLGSA